MQVRLIIIKSGVQVFEYPKKITMREARALAKRYAKKKGVLRVCAIWFDGWHDRRIEIFDKDKKNK